MRQVLSHFCFTDARRRLGRVERLRRTSQLVRDADGNGTWARLIQTSLGFPTPPQDRAAVTQVYRKRGRKIR